MLCRACRLPLSRVTAVQSRCHSLCSVLQLERFTCCVQEPARKLRLLANLVLGVARATQGAQTAAEQSSRLLDALYGMLTQHAARGTPQGETAGSITASDLCSCSSVHRG